MSSHKKSLCLVVGSLMVCLEGNLLIWSGDIFDFVCTFTVFCLSVDSSFQFKAITGTSLLPLFASLQIRVAISFDSHYLPLLFKYMPC